METPFREDFMESYKFYQNTSCEYYPCHQGANPESFNCLFCYCPLYALADQCGGNFSYLENGIKDCSACLIPHDPENYEIVIHRMEAVLELAKRGNNAEHKP